VVDFLPSRGGNPTYADYRDTVPVAATAVCLLMVNQHPQPVDDCPCFEDAIAFISVVLGELVGHWAFFQRGVTPEFFKIPQPGSTYSTITDVATWWLFSVIKVVVGILLLFTWRIFAKSSLHFALPKIFRFLASIFTLPNRRFYTPATDYEEVPIERGLHPIPSVIDLPTHLQVEMDDENVSVSTGRRGNVTLSDMKKRRNGSKNDFGQDFRIFGEKYNGTVRQVSESPSDGVKTSEGEVKHYDADGKSIPSVRRCGFSTTRLGSPDQGHRIRRYWSLGCACYPCHVRGPRLGCIERCGHPLPGSLFSLLRTSCIIFIVLLIESSSVSASDSPEFVAGR
jgi:hypothetical protein